jgi:hypothetical protein
VPVVQGHGEAVGQQAEAVGPVLLLQGHRHAEEEAEVNLGAAVWITLAVSWPAAVRRWVRGGVRPRVAVPEFALLAIVSLGALSGAF